MAARLGWIDEGSKEEVREKHLQEMANAQNDDDVSMQSVCLCGVMFFCNVNRAAAAMPVTVRVAIIAVWIVVRLANA